VMRMGMGRRRGMAEERRLGKGERENILTLRWSPTPW